jgi:hypothetical protein
MTMHGNDAALRFEGTYQKADMEALAGFTVSQLLDHRIGRATVSATVLLAIGAVLLRSWPVAIGGFLAVLGVSAFLRYAILPRQLIRHAGNVPATQYPRVILVDDRGLSHLSKGIEQHFERGAIKRMVLHKSHLFILLKPRGCMMLPLTWIHPPVTIEDVVTSLARRDHDQHA